ncbi:LysR family transcriptional regulator [Clostridium sp. YIM B02555]|uniref:LysR family transcriptional regulator n=1 Tax=Clostridium sp. YIM B02555 TaxID=2911968 RepID=UPI001EEE3A6A|nr:LysR family transcriptional regulator [Clostridium sp. YIM B02555]
MNQHIDCRLLNTFIAVCEEGSINKASIRLGYVQSTVSSQVINLENSIGKKLFEREKKGVVLTIAGKEVLEYAYRFIDLEKDLRESIDYLDSINGVVKIAALESFLSTTIPNVIHKFNMEYRDITFLLMSGFIKDMTQSLFKREIDFAIFPTNPENNMLDFEFLYTEELVFIGQDRFVEDFEKNKFNKKNVRFISFGTECIYSEIAKKYLRKYKYSESRGMNSFSVEGIKRMVECGIGISLIPKRYITNEPKNKKIKILPDMPVLKIDVGIVKLKNYELSKSAKLFKNFLVENINTMLESV